MVRKRLLENHFDCCRDRRKQACPAFSGSGPHCVAQDHGRGQSSCLVAVPPETSLPQTIRDGLIIAFDDFQKTLLKFLFRGSEFTEHADNHASARPFGSRGCPDYLGKKRVKIFGGGGSFLQRSHLSRADEFRVSVERGQEKRGFVSECCIETRFLNPCRDRQVIDGCGVISLFPKGHHCLPEDLRSVKLTRSPAPWRFICNDRFRNNC